jgi:hypothetical protein
MDKQIAYFSPDWEARYDSTVNGLRVVQGCLDLVNWYIDLELRYEARLADWMGLRYRNLSFDDYGSHISDHYFEPFFQIRPDQRLFLSITTHYNKGENQLGIGYKLGRDYVNYLETFIIAEHFDHNFSLMNIPSGPTKYVYRVFPIKWRTTFTKNWPTGRLRLDWELSDRYRLESTDTPVTYRQEGIHYNASVRFGQEFRPLYYGLIAMAQYRDTIYSDPSSVFENCWEKSYMEYFIEPAFGWRVSDRWRPILNLTYNHKENRDRLPMVINDVWAYFLDVEWRTNWHFLPGRLFVHLGTQREFYTDNRAWRYKERRLNVSLDYRYKNLWFNLHEAMEGDFPTPKWMHNHTYVQLIVNF